MSSLWAGLSHSCHASLSHVHCGQTRQGPPKAAEDRHPERLRTGTQGGWGQAPRGAEDRQAEFRRCPPVQVPTVLGPPRCQTTLVWRLSYGARVGSHLESQTNMWGLEQETFSEWAAVISSYIEKQQWITRETAASLQWSGGWGSGVSWGWVLLSPDWTLGPWAADPLLRPPLLLHGEFL